MEEVKLKPCLFCGGKAELSWGGVTEYYSKAEQDVTVDCENDPNDNHKGCTVSITIDSNSNMSGQVAELVAINAWNELNAQK